MSWKLFILALGQRKVEHSQENSLVSQDVGGYEERHIYIYFEYRFLMSL